MIGYRHGFFFVRKIFEKTSDHEKAIIRTTFIGTTSFVLRPRYSIDLDCSAMTNAREDAADASRLRLLLSERDRELDLLRSCLHCVREDLNGKTDHSVFCNLCVSC